MPSIKKGQPTSSIGSLFANSGVAPPQGKRKEPLWKGPIEEGITFSMLCRFLTCRERFRLYAIEGLKAEDTFNAKLEFGQMWHVCEEALAKLGLKAGGNLQVLTEYCQELCKKHPTQQEQIDTWYRIVKMMFPHYIRHWEKHPDVMNRTPISQEKVFCVPYKLPSGRVVKLLGKRDAVDLIGKGRKGGIYLQENKTKQRIDHLQLRRQLTFDLQTMMYLIALEHDTDERDRMGKELKYDYPICGVRYNVIRRPAQYQGKKETKEQFIERLSEVISDSPQEFFMRWKVEVSYVDQREFRRKCLNPLLEQLCDWWEVMNGAQDPFNAGIHWRHPFGVYNVLDEGGCTDVDGYLATGSEVGLQRVEELFPELRS